MFLLDTNIFLEVLLEQEKANEVKAFFQNTNLHDINLSDLALHSIGIILYRFKKFELFEMFVNDVILNGAKIASLNPRELLEMNHSMVNFNLDFDDAYQYQIAKGSGFQIISFDKDFDKTDLKRKEPLEVINSTHH